MNKFLITIKYFFGKPYLYVKREFYKYSFDRKKMLMHMLLLLLIIALYIVYLYFKLSDYKLSGLQLSSYKTIDYIALFISILKFLYPIIMVLIIKSFKHIKLLKKFISLGVEDKIEVAPRYIIINVLMVLFSLGGSYLLTRYILNIHISYVMIFSGILVFFFEFLYMFYNFITTKAENKTDKPIFELLFEKVTGEKL